MRMGDTAIKIKETNHMMNLLSQNQPQKLKEQTYSLDLKSTKERMRRNVWTGRRHEQVRLRMNEDYNVRICYYYYYLEMVHNRMSTTGARTKLIKVRLKHVTDHQSIQHVLRNSTTITSAVIQKATCLSLNSTYIDDGVFFTNYKF